MPEVSHHFLSAHASVNQMDKLAPHADSDGLHTSTPHQVPLACARPQMLFVFQEECVFVRAEEAKIEEVQNERPAEGAVALAGEAGGVGGGILQHVTKQGTQNRSYKQPRRRHFRSHLLPDDLGSGDPSDSHDAWHQRSYRSSPTGGIWCASTTQSPGRLLWSQRFIIQY